MPQFKKRTKGRQIFKFGSGNLVIDFSIEEANNVILHSGDYSVIVANIHKTSDGNFQGSVLGIEPPGAELNDVKAEDIVFFTEDQVISAAKRE